MLSNVQTLGLRKEFFIVMNYCNEWRILNPQVEETGSMHFVWKSMTMFMFIYNAALPLDDLKDEITCVSFYEKHFFIFYVLIKST